MMDPYGRFKLMQSLRAFLLITTPSLEDTSTTIFKTYTKMVFNYDVLDEIRLPPEGKQNVDITFYTRQLSDIWYPNIKQWDLRMQYDDYKQFIAYMRGEL